MFAQMFFTRLLKMLGANNSGWESYSNQWWMSSRSVSVELPWTLPPESPRLTSGRDPSKLFSPYWQRLLKPCGRSRKHTVVQIPRDSLSPYPSPTTASVATRPTSGDTANAKRRKLGRFSSPISLSMTHLRPHSWKNRLHSRSGEHASAAPAHHIELDSSHRYVLLTTTATSNLPAGDRTN